MNIYLDIDGMMIREDLSVRLGKSTNGLPEFLQATYYGGRTSVVGVEAKKLMPLVQKLREVIEK